MSKLQFTPSSLKDLKPLRKLKTKSVFAPNGIFTVKGELQNGLEGTISGRAGEGYVIYDDESIELLSIDDMQKEHEKAEREASKKEDAQDPGE